MEHPEKKSRRDKVQKHSRPPHLKGKEIGLYYAKLNRLKRNAEGGEASHKKDFFVKCVI